MGKCSSRIQKDFVKYAVKSRLKQWWESLSHDEQLKYLKLHPRSKLRPTRTKEQRAVSLLSSIVRRSPFKGKAFLAGGYVRDELLGLKPKDIDVTVEALNGGIDLAEYMSNELDIRDPVIFPNFGTAKIELKSGVDVEFVQTRNEEYVRHSRKPKTTFGTLMEDVERRDFTINTLLKDLTTGKVLDLTGKGREDLKNGIIRTPLDPNITFKDDPLRMMRAIRFATKYNFKLDDNIIPAIKVNAEELQWISKERIRDELNKILMTKRPSQGFELMKETGLLEQVLPELSELVGVEQGKYHYTDAWRHTMQVLDNTQTVQDPDSGAPINRLAGLLHDISKPQTKSIKDGEIHFYGHDAKSKEMAREILSRLRYSNKVIDDVSDIVGLHMRTVGSNSWNKPAIRRFIRDTEPLTDNLFDLLLADRKAHHPAKSDPASILALIKRVQDIKVETPVVRNLKLPITSQEIMSVLNIKPGPKVGLVRDYLTEELLENPDMTETEAVNKLKKKFLVV